MSPALWIPFIWLFFMGSRLLSEWFALFGFSIGGITLEDGSPLDAALWWGLVFAGLYVLQQRRISLTRFVQDNPLMTLYLIFCLAATIWSDFPLVAVKRWVKVVGHPVVALIIMSEPDPKKALIVLLKRISYILIPISVLFIKYYPEYGRAFSPWTGEASNAGITGGKNALGYDCLVTGLFFAWYFSQVWRSPKSKFRRNELILCGVLGYMIWWLLSMSNSSTSLMSLVCGLLLLLFLGLKIVDKRHVAAYMIAGIIIFAPLEVFFQASDNVVKMLGRDATLTGRTELWTDLWKMGTNPIIGTGFESFWLGDRLQDLWVRHPWRPNQAHNGYLETYLNLGIVGLFFMISLFLSTFWRASSGLIDDYDMNRLRLAFLGAMIVYNWTEGAFKALHPLYFVFFLISITHECSPGAGRYQRNGLHAGRETRHEIRIPA